MTVKIVLPESEEGQATPVIGTKIYAENGQEVKDVFGLDIHTEIGGDVTATIDVLIESIAGMNNVHALLGTKTLEQIAELHGLGLTTKSTVSLSDGIVSHKRSAFELADIKFKVDCTEIDEITATLDILAKYADELPQAMKDELSEIVSSDK